VTTAFAALAEPTRRQILDLLRDRERPVGDLVGRLAMSQPAVSKHLRVLRDAGLVDVRTDAQRRLYRVRLEPLREVDDWLAPYRAQWGEHLDRLEDHLDAMPDPADRPAPGSSAPSASSARATRTRSRAKRS